MTPDDHALVKEVFAGAIQRPDSRQVEYVRERCGGADEIESVVLDLLRHHHDATLLAPQVDSSSRGLPPKRLEIARAGTFDNYLVSSDVWEESRQVLRRRLVIIACVMSALIGISILRLFTHHYASIGYAARGVALGVSLAVAWILSTRHDLSLRQIRVAEFVVMANAGLLSAAISIRLMLDLAEEGFENEATLISVNNWNYFIWTLIIFVYGVFMPNSWRRAAAVLIPVAMIPTLVTVTANSLDPRVAQILGTDDFGRPIPTPFVAAGIAIYAAHLIHGGRLSAVRAKHLAQYHLKRLIGEGGMGQVFEAEHVMLKRACAIKIIRAEYCIDDRALQRFEREVQATARLTHPHTVEVYDYGQTKDDVFFFAMELLPGMHLGDLVEAAGPLPPERAVHFLSDVCAALREAHDAGLIHRDIKPANIFASQRGGIWDFTKLLDFGLVREVAVDPSLSLSFGKIAGSPGFMAPEQVTSPAGIDPRADLYSVAAVGYFLLTGRPPFTGESAMEIMIAQSQRPPAPPSSFRPDIPADLESVIVTNLSLNPADRHADITEMRNALLRCRCSGKWTEQDAAAWWEDETKPSEIA